MKVVHEEVKSYLRNVAHAPGFSFDEPLARLRIPFIEPQYATD